jgi:hypothetical protein
VTSDGAVRHVEKLAARAEETDPTGADWLLDDAATPSSTFGGTVGGATGIWLYGLWHLNGQTVTVVASGYDCGDFPVANGQCFVPFGDGVQNLHTQAFSATASYIVGFTYTSQGQLLRPMSAQDTGAAVEGFAKTRRTQMYGAQVVRSAGAAIGTTFTKLRAIVYKFLGGKPYDPLTLFSGIKQDTIEDTGGPFDSQISWQITRPVPHTVVALGGFIHTQDR